MKDAPTAPTRRPRPEFWAAKFEQNRARDARVTAALGSAGWRVLTVWECETDRAGVIEARLLRVLDDSRR